MNNAHKVLEIIDSSITAFGFSLISDNIHDTSGATLISQPEVVTLRLVFEDVIEYLADASTQEDPAKQAELILIAGNAIAAFGELVTTGSFHTTNGTALIRLPEVDGLLLTLIAINLYLDVEQSAKAA